MKAIMKIEKSFDLFEKALNLIIRIFLGAIILVIFYSVIMRYVFCCPPAWAEELSRFIFIWVVMLGAILVTREQSHIEFTILVDRFPKKAKFAVSTFTRLLMLSFCWIMVREGVRIYPIVSEASSPTFAISMGWMYMTIPVGGFLMGIFILENTVKSFFLKEQTPTT